MKILIIEDEPKAADYLRKGLAESGYAVEVEHSGTDWLHAAANGDHDLVILDVMLPGIDGFAVLSALRTSKEVPVLILTARGNTEHGNTIRFIVTNSGKIKHEMVLGAAICAEGTLRNHEKIRQWSTPTRIWSRRPPA